jgi:N-methylhydantoinase A/oxoprolinase/acetone carboxylase beta subunit
MPAGRLLNAPAVLVGPDATGLIEPGWRGVVHASGAVILERA